MFPKSGRLSFVYFSILLLVGFTAFKDVNKIFCITLLGSKYVQDIEIQPSKLQTKFTEHLNYRSGIHTVIRLTNSLLTKWWSEHGTI